MNQATRPSNDEYDSYYAAYVDRVESDNIVEVLRLQQADTESVLMNLQEEQADYRYEPDKWSVKQVVGHLSDTERVFTYRALCIARGESNSLPGMDQDRYVSGADFDSRKIESLAEEFSSVRSATISFFENLEPDGWIRSGIANQVPVSVRSLAFIIAGHESHHMAILRERYRVES